MQNQNVGPALSFPSRLRDYSEKDLKYFFPIALKMSVAFKYAFLLSAKSCSFLSSHFTELEDTNQQVNVQYQQSNFYFYFSHDYDDRKHFFTCFLEELFLLPSPCLKFLQSPEQNLQSFVALKNPQTIHWLERKM